MTIKETDLSAANYVAEQEVKEDSARNRAFYLGENDARLDLEPDPSRHAAELFKTEHFDYHQGYRAERDFTLRCEELDRKKALREEAEKETLRRMTLHTEDVCRKIVPAGSQRFRVIHANSMGVWLNKDEHGFATFEAAKLRALDLAEDNDSLPGDVITIEEKGQILFLFTKEAS